MIAGSNEQVNSANDCIESQGKPQKNEADTWPPLWKAGKKSLQRLPPEVQNVPVRRLASFAMN